MRGAVAGAALAALLAAVVLDRLSPVPSADVSRGSEEAFGVRGLDPRELRPRQPPLRWTALTPVFRFRNLPPGPALLQVRLRDQRGPVAVVAKGMVLGVLRVGVLSADLAIPAIRGDVLEVELRVAALPEPGKRKLGVLLDRVTLIPAPPRFPSPGLLLSVLGPALAIVFGGMAAGLAPGVAALLSVAVSVLQALALWPCGLVRSDYAWTLGGLLAVGAGVATAFGRAMGRSVAGSSAWAFGAFLAAFLVQGIAAASPIMVVSDDLLHANKLAAVAAGDLFPTSVTQHERPFRFPYGVSFYALLAPWAWRDTNLVYLVKVVRGAAAAAGVLASAGLYGVLAPAGAVRAGLAVILLQLLPETFHVYSGGALSNVFGQAMTVLFFAWWAGKAPGGWFVGAGLLALAGLGHLSSLIVLVASCAALVLVRRGEVWRDRARSLALTVGLALVALYYLQFSSLILDELPRLLEGGGRGGPAAQGTWGLLWHQVLSALGRWGVPAILLAAVGSSEPAQGGPERDLRALLPGVALLVVPAVISPLEVRYQYALTAPLAVVAASGLVRLWQRGTVGRLLAGGLLTAQAVIGARSVVEDVLIRYRG